MSEKSWEEKYLECLEREKRREEEYQLQLMNQKQIIDQLASQLPISSNPISGDTPTATTNGAGRPPIPKSVPPPPVGLSPLKKLETDYADCKRDLKRVMDKLSSTESQLMEKQTQLERISKQYNESNSRVNELEKENRLLADKLETSQTKMAHSEEIRQQLANLQIQYDSCNEKLSLTIQQKDDCNDQLQDATTKLREAMTKIQEMEANKGKLDLQYANQQGTIEELNHDKEKLIAELQLMQKNYKEDMEKANDKTAQMEKEVLESKERNTLLCAEIEQIKQRCENTLNEYKEQIQKLEQKTMTSEQEFQNKVHETQVSYKISQKKHNQMLKELQIQLKNEVLKSQQLKCQVSKLEDELKNAKDEDRHFSPPAEAFKPPPPKPPSIVQPDMNNIQLEVSQAIAKKLEKAEETNFLLKEQIKYLQETVQLLTQDLNEKKTQQITKTPNGNE